MPQAENQIEGTFIVILAWCMYFLDLLKLNWNFQAINRYKLL